MPINTSINQSPLFRPVLSKIMAGVLEVYPGLGGGTPPAFNPQSLFANGEQGAWWDYYDDMDHKIKWCADNPGFTSATFLAQYPNHALFQDSAGTIPVTNVEQPLGKVLDKSGRGNHLVQPTAVARPVLSARKNLLLATNTMSTQSVTVVAGQCTLSHTGTGTITLTGASTAGPLVGAGSLTFTPTAGSLTLTVSGTVTNAQLEYAATASTYQRVTTATDYDTMGFAFYRSDDGIDDGMATAASVNMSSTDKLAVFVGDANGNIANTGTLIESSPAYMNNAGSFALLVPSLSTSRGSFGSNGGSGGGEKEIQEPPIGQYRKRVITAYNDFATDGDYGCDYIRTNGIPLAGLVGAGNSNVGAGPYGNHTFYTGSRNNTSNRFKGHVHQMIVLGREPTQEDLDNTEGYIFERQWGTPPEPSVFTPADLFKSGEQGVWYDPSDISTMFQDTAGTTPVTAVGQPVGLMLDKSQGLALGPPTIDGSFTSTSNWAGFGANGWSIIDNQAVRSSGQSNTSQINRTDGQSFAAGKWYSVSMMVFDVTGEIRLVTNTNQSIFGSITTPGLKTAYYYNVSAVNAQVHGISAATCTIDDIVIREISGNHATQATAASRPVYRDVGGYQYLEFDGVDDVLASSTVADAGAPVEYWASSNIVVGSATAGLFFTGAVGSSVTSAITSGLFQRSDGANRILRMGMRIGSGTINTAIDTSAFTIGAPFVGRGIANVSPDELAVDTGGAPVTALATYDGTPAPHAYVLGTSLASANLYTYGALSIDRRLTAGEATALRNYLNAKAGI